MIYSSSSFDVLNRFLKYVKIHTTSKEGVNKIPSTECQIDLAKLLVEELKAIGASEIILDEHCIIYATIASNIENNLSSNGMQKIPTVCFIAHLDTSPEESGQNVNAQIITYQGGDITFPKAPNLIISPQDTPCLTHLQGEKLVISDGTTLLGADDKAGIAEIMSAIEYIAKHPEIKHGPIKILFTPDEEVGQSADAVDIKKIGADFAYTLDGDEIGVVETECFNAAGGTIMVQGYNVHPGYAYGKMINSIRILAELIELFPKNNAPETTKDYEGYLHPGHVHGDVNHAQLDFIIRDFDRIGLEMKITDIQNGVARIQAKYPAARITMEFKQGYRNMKEILEQNPLIVEIAEEAIRKAEITPLRKAIRGGTDGARLCFMGLPTPNIFAGGVNFHSKKEFIPVLWMEKATETIITIIELIPKKVDFK